MRLDVSAYLFLFLFRALELLEPSISTAVVPCYCVCRAPRGARRDDVVAAAGVSRVREDERS